MNSWKDNIHSIFDVNGVPDFPDNSESEHENPTLSPEESLSKEEVKEVKELLKGLKNNDDFNYPEDEINDTSYMKNSRFDFLAKINKTVLFICILILTIACWVCFRHIAFGIAFVLEVLVGCIFAIYYTMQEDDVIHLDTLSDGFKLIRPDGEDKKLADLVMQEPVEELKDLVDYVKEPHEFEKMGYIPETKILIIGESGFGKGTLIKALANEMNLNIIQIHASRFFDTENVIEKLFELVQKASIPYIVHIDAFEKLTEHTDSEMETPDAILDKLQTYLDIYPQVILIATCEDSSALISNEDTYSRFFKKAISLEVPNQEERCKLLKEFTANNSLAEDVDLEQIAKNCYGSSIGELKFLVSTSISVARKNNHSKIEMDDFFQAFDSLEFGKAGKKHSEESQKIAAYHEAGHALVHYLKNGRKNLLRVISIGRGNAGGLTYFSIDDDKLVLTKEDLLNKVCVSYGGRCAEKLIFNHYSTGASVDISQATSIIGSMIREYGMSDEIGPINVSPKIAVVSVLNESPYMLNLISSELVKIGKQCEEETFELLKANREKLDCLANYLIEHESITGEEMDALLKNI